AAGWILALGDRSVDRAELLVHHWQQALALTRAAGKRDGELATRARVALREAGDRAMALHAYGRALGFFTKALELWPAGCPQRGELLLELGRARLVADTAGAAERAEARDALLEAGQRARAAEAEMLLNQLAWRTGRSADRAVHRDRALALVEDEPPSASKGRVLAGIASELVFTDHPGALESGRAALGIARQLGPSAP